MKRLLNATLALLAFPAMLHAQPKPGRVYFQEIREKAAKLERNSAEDLALGRQLIEEMRALGATRKKPAPRTFLVMETLPYAGQMWSLSHIHTDRQLFAARDMWEHSSSVFKKKGAEKTFELQLMSGVECHDPFADY